MLLIDALAMHRREIAERWDGGGACSHAKTDYTTTLVTELPSGGYTLVITAPNGAIALSGLTEPNDVKFQLLMLGYKSHIVDGGWQPGNGSTEGK